MYNNLFKVQIAIIAIALLSGCRPVAAPVSNDAASNSNTITITPGADVISISTVEHVVLLHTFRGHSQRVLDIAFSAQGELIASSSQDMNIKLSSPKQ